MPNIRQQEKRVRTSARERLENLRYRSGIKTLTRRLRDIVENGEGDVAQAHVELVKMIDKAAARGAIHKNTAARKKSQAQRLAATPPPAPVEAPVAKAPAKGRGKAKAKASA
jgi:small subunit ribosomal protein S20